MEISYPVNNRMHVNSVRHAARMLAYSFCMANDLWRSNKQQVTYLGRQLDPFAAVES